MNSKYNKKCLKTSIYKDNSLYRADGLFAIFPKKISKITIEDVEDNIRKRTIEEDDIYNDVEDDIYNDVEDDTYDDLEDDTYDDFTSVDSLDHSTRTKRGLKRAGIEALCDLKPHK